MFLFTPKRFADRIKRNPKYWLVRAFDTAQRAKESQDLRTANIIWAVLWIVWRCSYLKKIEDFAFEVEIDSDSKDNSGGGKYDLAVFSYAGRRMSVPAPLLKFSPKRGGREEIDFLRPSSDDLKAFADAIKVEKVPGRRVLKAKFESRVELLDELGIDNWQVERAVEAVFDCRKWLHELADRRYPAFQEAQNQGCG